MAKRAHGRNALVDGDPGKAKGPEARSFRGLKRHLRGLGEVVKVSRPSAPETQQGQPYCRDLRLILSFGVVAASLWGQAASLFE